jgi:surface protein
MKNTFYNLNRVTSLDVANWNTGKVTDMSGMFAGTTSLNSLDVSRWNTSNVTTMGSMFLNSNKMTTLDVSNWDTSKVGDMDYLFSQMSNLQTLDLSKWDTSSVQSMREMFSYMASLTSLNVKNINNLNISDLNGLLDIFKNDSNLTEFLLGPNFVFKNNSPNGNAALPAIIKGGQGKWVNKQRPDLPPLTSEDIMNNGPGNDLSGEYGWQAEPEVVDPGTVTPEVPPVTPTDPGTVTPEVPPVTPTDPGTVTPEVPPVTSTKPDTVIPKVPSVVQNKLEKVTAEKPTDTKNSDSKKITAIDLNNLGNTNNSGQIQTTATTPTSTNLPDSSVENNSNMKTLPMLGGKDNSNLTIFGGILTFTSAAFLALKKRQEQEK